MIQIGESYKKKKLRKMNPTQIIAFKYDANVQAPFDVLHGGNLSMCCTHTEIETIAIHMKSARIVAKETTSFCQKRNL